MKRQWTSLTVEEAKKHPLYGIKGWLAFFVFVMTMGTLGQLGTMSNEARVAGMTLAQLLSTDQPATPILIATIVIDVIAFTLFFVLLIKKHKAFRAGTTLILVALSLATLLMGILTPDKNMAGQLSIDFFTRSFWGAIWIAYLHRSRRVRVTFEKAVLASERLPHLEPKAEVTN